ncbi:HoxN/HupN/NixA family nickel/cobalt transporter [Paraburkholderia bengalensis]|uniref:Nickel/cobalt efflux system n=1 Tax=Paraburkholderia bengalensis TaxID=2747562 RepID=A0ABU8J2V5_9BURK
MIGRKFAQEMATSVDRKSTTRFYSILVIANVMLWLWAAVEFRGNTVGIGLALTAFGLGLRHAFDADHIAAIDNATRKLIRAGRGVIGVGFFFALGHSLVVLIAATGIALGARSVSLNHPELKEFGCDVASVASFTFLLLIGLSNVALLKDSLRCRRIEKAEGDCAEPANLQPAGYLMRALFPFFTLVEKSWHMALVGAVFGLGFDTATEIALLSLSAGQAADGVAINNILIFPALFGGAMTLADSTDGVLMNYAYRWSIDRSGGVAFYNTGITALSICVAMVIGLGEALSFVSRKFSLTSGPWDAINRFNENLNLVGFLVVAVFAVGWAVSAGRYRMKQRQVLVRRA